MKKTNTINTDSQTLKRKPTEETTANNQTTNIKQNVTQRRQTNKHKQSRQRKPSK